MVGGPEDDVPTVSGPLGNVADGDATAAELRPPAGAIDDAEEIELEEETVQSVAPKLTQRTPGAPPVPAPRPAAGVPASVPPPLPKRASVPSVGAMRAAFGPPPSSDAVSTPKAIGLPSSVAASTEPSPGRAGVPSVAGDDDEPVTTTSTRPSAGKLPLPAPGAVEIRNGDDDDELMDETEVRTMPGAPPTPLRSRPPLDPVEDGDDGPTTQVASTSAPSAAAGTERALESVPDLETRRVENVAATDAFDSDESVTSRALAADALDDSVTQQAPNVPPKLALSAVGVVVRHPPDDSDDSDDSTGGQTTTQKARAPAASPADGEPESITTQAPGLTNMLRVIAAEGPEVVARVPDDDEDESLPQNQTAVMVHAPVAPAAQADAPPVKLGTIQGFPPPPSPIGGGRVEARAASAVAAPQLEPSSDSGLRVARPGSGSGERASVGRLVASDAEPPRNVTSESGASPAYETSSRGIPFAATDLAPFGVAGPPSLHDVAFTKGPRYGLLVGVVAAISILVPVLLFVVLSRPSEERAPEPTGFEQAPGLRADALRTKAGKHPPPSPSAAPSASAPQHKH